MLQVYLYEAIEIENLETDSTFKVNGQCLKPFVEVKFDARPDDLYSLANGYKPNA